MRWIVEPLARNAARRPWWVIIPLVVITGVLGALASQQQTATDITEFSADTELARGFERIDEQFGARGGVQIVVDAGAGGDVLDRDGLIAATEIEQLIRDTPAVADRLAAGTESSPAVSTWADPVLARAATLDLQARELTPVFADGLVAGAAADGTERMSRLLSDDFDPGAGRARAGLVVVELASDLGFDQRLAAATALDDALADAELGSLSAQPFSFELLNDDIQAGFQTELPQLLGISLVLMLIILVALYRRASDVIIGLLGLMATIVWMTGLSVLLGPEYLGITGEFNQLAIAVPVLLVGLGIDYSVHLTTRYREGRLAGSAPAPAAATSVRTVGVALTLATLTTVFGFLSNLVAPLPPIQDFGLFAAAGVASAFVVLGGLVPAARVLLDRRAPDRAAPLVAEGTGTQPATRAVAATALRAPAVIVAVAAVLGLAGAAASTDLSTQFSQEEFIPSDSEMSQVMTQLDERFGGDVSEETFLLVDGDFTEVGTWQALAAVERELAEVDGVVTTAEGRAEATSPTGLLAQRTQAATEAVARLQGQLAAALGEGAADQPPLVVLPDELTLRDVPAPLRDQLGDLDADQALAQASGGPSGTDPLDLTELTPLLPPGTDADAVVAERLPAGQLADRVQAALSGGDERALAGLDPERVAALARADPSTVGLADLEAAGYPVSQLDAATRELLADAQALREAGWTGSGLADDADIATIREILAGPSGDGLEGVLAGDAQAALARVATRAGDQGAVRLAADFRQRLAPLEQTGAEALVASQPLLINETLDELSAAQTQAIIVSLTAALALLVGYYTVTRRRPLLGVITMLPALLAVPLVLGSMWLLGLSFNALTATIASIAIGIGVPYGIHLTNRFVEEIRGGDVDAAIRATLTNTGAALVGSALTTGTAFAVLLLSSFPPIAQFGGITALTIAYALLASAIVETAALVWWGRREVRRRPGHADVAIPSRRIAG
jgi:predicted RND superfamily exporter protein